MAVRYMPIDDLPITITNQPLMANEIIKHQPQNALVKKADNYLAHLNALMPKKYAPDLPELIPYRKGDLWGFCDRDKNIVIECKYDSVEIFSEGLALVKKDINWSFVDKNGFEVIQLEFQHVKPFSEGLAGVKKLFCKYNDGSEDSRWGFINKEGKEVILCNYKKVGYFKDGLVNVHGERTSYHIDNHGERIMNYIYDDVQQFSEGLAGMYYTYPNGRQGSGFIDKSGVWLIQTLYESVEPFSDGLAVVRRNGRSHFIDKLINMAIPMTFASAQSFSEGIAAVLISYNEKWKFIDKKGNDFIAQRFDDVLPFNQELAGVMLDGYWGFIDKHGLFVIPPKYPSFVTSFKDGLAKVGNFKYHEYNVFNIELYDGYFDKLGNEYWEGEYSDEKKKEFERKMAYNPIDHLPY